MGSAIKTTQCRRIEYTCRFSPHLVNSDLQAAMTFGSIHEPGYDYKPAYERCMYA